MKDIVNSGEFGARNDGVTPISNRQATSDDAPTSHQLTIALKSQMILL
ncbi:hypothetical protein [Candidatus Tisiphia endosymbiont of Mystacides longicornis]